MERMKRMAHGCCGVGKVYRGRENQERTSMERMERMTHGNCGVGKVYRGRENEQDKKRSNQKTNPYPQ
jgi:hypothetical protein